MNWLRNFMIGRYGVDSLSLFLLVVSMIVTLFSSIFGSVILLLISYALWIWMIFRTLSRNLDGRRRENDRFMTCWNWVLDHTKGFRRTIGGWFRRVSGRYNDRKTHKYFRCPKCRQMVRVPKYKGKVRIICPKCKNEFVRNTGKSPAQKARAKREKDDAKNAKREKKAARSSKK